MDPMLFFSSAKLEMPSPESALPGREEALIEPPDRHFALGTPMVEPFDGMELVMFGMGCFWGAERKFWEAEGVHSTQVGYAAGYTPNPTYEEVCSGRTGHNEVVRVAFDPEQTSFEAMLRVFWESHDPTQGMKQGNDVGTQYRSGIYVYGQSQKARAEQSRQAYEVKLKAEGYGPITTEIRPAPAFYYAEAYHQQYLGKNPTGYCGLGGTGVACPVGLASS